MHRIQTNLQATSPSPTQDAFAAYTLAADLLELQHIFAHFFAQVTANDWLRRTESRSQGWTLCETIAHLDAVAQAYHTAATAALNDQPCLLPGMTRRTELNAWNQREIATRANTPITALCASFLSTLHTAAQCAALLSQTDLAKTTITPIYHGPMSVAELLGGQLAHAGLFHAAQVAGGAQVAPLWHTYTPTLMNRNISRMFAIIGHAYWPERGGDLRAAMDFIIDGPGGGAWHVAMAPEGGSGYIGRAQRAAITLWFRDTNVFCRVMTLQGRLLPMLLRGQLRIWGNLKLGVQFPMLFKPT